MVSVSIEVLLRLFSKYQRAYTLRPLAGEPAKGGQDL